MVIKLDTFPTGTVAFKCKNHAVTCLDKYVHNSAVSLCNYCSMIEKKLKL